MRMAEAESFLVVQTAFAGDLICTLPLLQALRREFPTSRIAVVAIPGTAGLLANHPAVDEIYVYDKREADRGLWGLLRLSRLIRAVGFATAIVPHRSLRSALLVWKAGIPRRIGFHTSAGRRLFTHIVRYDASIHEIERNLSLMSGVTGKTHPREVPRLNPSAADRSAVDSIVGKEGSGSLVAVAPGTVWNTKRWPAAKFVDLIRILHGEGHHVVLVGGMDDGPLAASILSALPGGRITSAVGKLTLLQSAELIRRCSILVSNDSAPMHLAVAVQTPVVALFGATVPAFGFAPLGAHDRVIEVTGLPCRPCSIHGGRRCPIGTFDCMNRISALDVSTAVREILAAPVVRSAPE